MKRRISKVVLYITIIFCFSIIIGISSFKVIKNHHEKILLVEEKYIIETAIACINQNICQNDEVTLKEMYEKKIMERQVNGVTKEYYNELSYVKKENGKYILIIL